MLKSTIPFGNTVQGHMNDTPFSAQNSRLTLAATAKRGAADLKAALELDFLGNAPNGFKTYSLATDSTFNKTATGGAVNVALEPVPAVRLVANGFLSSGGGRYLANTNLPDFIVNPDASLTLVKTQSYLIGTEIQAGHKTGLYACYNEAHADRAVTSDVDGSAIGFGVAGSTMANGRVGEATAGITQTFFRDPKIGGIQFMVQYSHVRRTPFSVPAGTPADPAVNMLYMNVRYFLP